MESLSPVMAERGKRSRIKKKEIESSKKIKYPAYQFPMDFSCDDDDDDATPGLAHYFHLPN